MTMDSKHQNISNTKNTQKRRPNKLIILVALLLISLAVGGAVWVYPTASNEGYAPEQPIPFSHKIHAGDNKIPCLYCHSSAEKSRHAAIPSSNVCMNCHRVVKTESPYIRKITESFNNGTPIEWVRIHELPDFTYFSHKRHLAKGLACETCHGDVKTMEVIEQSRPLTMGWCIDCHRGLTTPPEVLQRIYPGESSPHGPAAPTNCTTCHQ